MISRRFFFFLLKAIKYFVYSDRDCHRRIPPTFIYNNIICDNGRRENVLFQVIKWSEIIIYYQKNIYADVTSKSNFELSLSISCKLLYDQCLNWKKIIRGTQKYNLKIRVFKYLFKLHIVNYNLIIIVLILAFYLQNIQMRYAEMFF